MKRLLSVFGCLCMFVIFGCSSSSDENLNKEVEKKMEQTAKRDSTVKIYTELDTIKVEKQKEVKKTNQKLVYMVQIGAFTTESKANSFASNAKKKLNLDITVQFQQELNLYTVSLPYSSNREDAEKIRTELRKTKDFSDAFIVTKEQ